LEHGYQQTGSFGPHVAVVLMALGNAGRAHLSMSRIVDWGVAEKGQRWSVLWMSLGITSLLDLPLSSEERKLLGDLLRLSYRRLARLYRDAGCYALRSGDAVAAHQIFRALRRRQLGCSQPLLWRGVAAAMQYTLRFPLITLPVMNLLHKVIIGDSLLQHADGVPCGPTERA
jgi:hypothetical protein